MRASARQSVNAAAAKTHASFSEMEMQQLRGVFAAHDEDKDGKLSRDELCDCLRALGFQPTDKLLRGFFMEQSRRNPATATDPTRGFIRAKIDLGSFLAAAHLLNDAPDCADEILALLQLVDTRRSGTLPCRDVRHLLHDVVCPTRLSRQELAEFFDCCAVLQGTTPSSRVDYEDLLESMMFA